MGVHSLRPALLVASVALVGFGWTGSSSASPLADGTALARADLELQLILEINRAREARGLAPLAADPLLGELARQRSWELATSGQLSHYGPDGSLRFVVLLDQRGVPYDVAGENLGWNVGPDAEGPRVAVETWAASPAHAANLFGARFSVAGLGAVSVDGRTYYTLLVTG